MKMIRKIVLPSLLLVTALFVQNAAAALLPFSTFGSAGGWQGTRYYDIDVVGAGVLRGRVDFAVYDTQKLQFTGEIALADNWDKPGRYIYTYQILNDLSVGNEAVLSFAVFNKTAGMSLDVEKANIGSLEDTPNSGVQPTAVDLTAGNLEVIWEFEASGVAILDPGDHSYFLIISSDAAPTVGNFQIKAFEGSPPVSQVPEPGTATLFVVGTVMFMIRRKSAR